MVAVVMVLYTIAAAAATATAVTTAARLIRWLWQHPSGSSTGCIRSPALPAVSVLLVVNIRSDATFTGAKIWIRAAPPAHHLCKLMRSLKKGEEEKKITCACECAQCGARRSAASNAKQKMQEKHLLLPKKKKKQKKYLRRYNKNSTPLFSFPSVAGSLGGGGDVAVAILLVMNQLIYHHHRH